MEDGEKEFFHAWKKSLTYMSKQADACKKSSSKRRGHTGFEAVDDTAAAAWYGNEVRVHTHLDTTRLPNAATAAERGQRVASHR